MVLSQSQSVRLEEVTPSNVRTTNMKSSGHVTPPKEYNNCTGINPINMEIYNLLNKDFKIVVLACPLRHKKTQWNLENNTQSPQKV